MKPLHYLFIVTILLTSCKPEEKSLTAQQIIDKSIEVSQVNKLSNAELQFNFREHRYLAKRENGIFVLQRITTNKPEIITDVLNNKGFQRYINEKAIQVEDSMAIKYSESINSVHYFSALPLGLNDKAVQKKLLKDTNLKGEEYYRVQITFAQEGGGVDYDDVFIYWVGKEDFKIDYLAYTFHVNGGGMRFREVRKEHFINGIRLVDYNNYKPQNLSIELNLLDREFENNQLIKASEINLENIEVSFN